jgi:hypothetical protein
MTSKDLFLKMNNNKSCMKLTSLGIWTPSSILKIFRFQQALAVTFLQKCKMLKIIFKSLLFVDTLCIEQVVYKKTWYCLEAAKKAR